MVTIINKFGKLTGWNSLTINFLGRDIEGVTEFEYSDEVQMDSEYGQGGYPIGYSKGNYKAKGSITLYSEEIVGMQASLAPGMRIQDVPPFPINLQYELVSKPIRDICQNVIIMNIGKAVKNGEGKMVHKCDLLMSHIDWNQ